MHYRSHDPGMHYSSNVGFKHFNLTEDPITGRRTLKITSPHSGDLSKRNRHTTRFQQSDFMATQLASAIVRIQDGLKGPVGKQLIPCYHNHKMNNLLILIELNCNLS